MYLAVLGSARAVHSSGGWMLLGSTEHYKKQSLGCVRGVHEVCTIYSVLGKDKQLGSTDFRKAVFPANQILQQPKLDAAPCWSEKLVLIWLSPEYRHPSAKQPCRDAAGELLTYAQPQ